MPSVFQRHVLAVLLFLFAVASAHAQGVLERLRGVEADPARPRATISLPPSPFDPHGLVRRHCLAPENDCLHGLTARGGRIFAVGPLERFGDGERHREFLVRDARHDAWSCRVVHPSPESGGEHMPCERMVAVNWSDSVNALRWFLVGRDPAFLAEAAASDQSREWREKCGAATPGCLAQLGLRTLPLLFIGRRKRLGDFSLVDAFVADMWPRLFRCRVGFSVSPVRWLEEPCEEFVIVPQRRR